MKKGLIYFVVFLFVVQIALADITVDPITRDKYNLGEKINLKGAVLFEEDLQGSLSIDLKCADQTLPVYFTLLDLEADESQDYNLNIPTRKNLQGDCQFLVRVGGAAENFEKTSSEFIITNELNVDVSVDRILVNPGDSLVITGNAKKVNGDLVENGAATLIIDGDSELVTLKEGLFEYNLQLGPSANSGKHVIEFSVTDDNGNEGRDDTSFKVSAIPTNINLIVDKSYAPGESILGKALLYDQAGVLMQGDGSVEVYDTNGKIEYSQNVKSDQNFEFVLDSFSMPGTWRINVIFSNLESNKNVEIETVKEINTWIEDGFLFVQNVGNVDYNDPVEITLEGADSQTDVIKETSLKPNQTIQFDLGKEVKYSGEYQVKSGNEITGNVVLEGRKNIGSTIVGWIAVMFVFVFFIYMVARKGVSLRSTKKTNSVKEIRAKGKSILERSQTKEDKIRQEDIDHLVNRAKDQPKEDSTDSKNMFRIFD